MQPDILVSGVSRTDGAARAGTSAGSQGIAGHCSQDIGAQAAAQELASKLGLFMSSGRRQAQALHLT